MPSENYHVVHRGDAMLQSLELYFMINFAVDAALIAVVARANGCLRLRNVLLGGLMSSGYALIVESAYPSLAHPMIQMLLILLLTLIVCGDPAPRRCGIIAFQLLCGAMMLGGFAGLARKSGEQWIAAGIGAGLLALHLLITTEVRRTINWEVTICVHFRGRSTSFRALIDTGNRLREPISGLPVLIAEQSLLSSIFPPNQEMFAGRKISFGALGGGGTVRCFRPDLVLIRRGDSFVRAPEIWIAVYPGSIPGTSRALAPPEFAVIRGRMQTAQYSG